LPADDRPSAHLSVGNQQRLNLAIAFLGAPRVLLLDEPTASLDPAQAHALWERVARARADDAAVVVATHYLDEAVAADRVLTLREGSIASETAGDDSR
jgi:ABC-2 type transport system ATP-binding protein